MTGISDQHPVTRSHTFTQTLLPALFVATALVGCASEFPGEDIDTIVEDVGDSGPIQADLTSLKADVAQVRASTSATGGLQLSLDGIASELTATAAIRTTLATLDTRTESINTALSTLDGELGTANTTLTSIQTSTGGGGAIQTTLASLDTATNASGPIQTTLGTINSAVGAAGPLQTTLTAINTAVQAGGGLQTTLTTVDSAVSGAGPIQTKLSAIQTSVETTETTATTIQTQTDHSWVDTGLTLGDINGPNGGPNTLYAAYPWQQWEYGITYASTFPMVVDLVVNWNQGWRIMTRRPFLQGDDATTMVLGYFVFTTGTADVGGDYTTWYQHYYRLVDGNVTRNGGNGASNTVKLWARRR